MPQACSWPIDRTCLPALPVVSDPPVDGEQAAYDKAIRRQLAAEDLASTVLWALSGRQFGICSTVARPCPEGPNPFDRLRTYSGDVGFVTLVWNGSGWATDSCGCIGKCVEIGPRAVHLPGPVVNDKQNQPQTYPLTVTIGDVVLADDEWSLEGNVLFRHDGRWPGQHRGRPLGEPGTWSVEYWKGQPAPAGSATYVGILAAEMILACNGDKKCRLPRNVKAVTRQGVTYEMYDVKGIYTAGKTGIPEIDLWLSAFNPMALTQSPRVR